MNVHRPNFFILGAAKCGTTSLYHGLFDHPMITLSVPKEPSFFEVEYDLGMEYYWQKYFSHWSGEKAIGDARAAHLLLPYVAERIRESVPNARFIVIVRNPIDRLRSHWWMRLCSGLESLSLEDAIRSNLEAIESGRTFFTDEGIRLWQTRVEKPEEFRPVYLEFGHYAEQLEGYYRLFDRDQVLLLFFEDLIANSAQLFREIYEFLDVDPNVSPPADVHYNAALSKATYMLQRLDRKLGVPRFITPSVREWMKSTSSRGKKPQHISPAAREILREYYVPHNRALEVLTGRDLSDWDK